MRSRAPAMLICLFLLPAFALAGDDSREGVYVRFGLGPSWFDGLELERSDSPLPFPYGFNAGARNMPLETEEAGLGEAAVGYSFNNHRLELMFSAGQAEVWSKPATRLGFGSSYYGGSNINSGGWAYGGGWGTSSSEYEELTIHTLSLNAYIDFPSKKGRVVPYVGIGTGAAFVDLPSRQYAAYGGSWYGPVGVPEPGDGFNPPEEPTDSGGDPGSEGRGDGGGPIPTEPGWPWPGAFEGSRQTDVSGASFMYAFYGGVDYRIVSDVYLGMRIGYVRVGEVEADMEPAWGGVRGYQTAEIDGLSHWTAVMTLRLLRL